MLSIPRLTYSLLFLTHAIAFAEEQQPVIGMAYNTIEMSSVTYECSPENDGQIECNFIQTKVRPKLTSDGLKTKMRELDTQLADEKKLSQKDCDFMRRSLDVLEGRSEAETPLGFKDAREKQSVEKIARAIVKHCDSGNTEDLRRVIEEGYRQELRTCLISANTFQQTLRRVSDPANGAFSWVADPTPQGACGVVQLSRFEPKRLMDGKLTVWNYIARRAITNPDGEVSGTMKCGDLDQETYVFSYEKSAGEWWADCEKIEFSPL